MKTAGVMFDFYDDPDGSVLKKFFPTSQELPEVVKHAHILSEDERGILRDEAYALIMVNEGRTLRKFACVDPGNTFLSALYFVENRDRLPEEAEKIAAENITAACEEFNLPFSNIVKEAMKKSPQRTRNPTKQSPAGDEADWAARTNLLSIQGTADDSKVLNTANMKLASFEDEHGISDKRKGDVDLEDHHRLNPGTRPPKRKVDVTGKERRKVVEKKAAVHMALGKYPLDSYADVQRAVEYFEETHTEMSPKDRHEYCVKTAARAVELGIDITDRVERYGSTEFSPDLDAHLSHRRSMSEPEYHEVYDALQEKRASIKPEAFAELLAEADKVSGLDWHYPQVSDPYFATFGGNAVKEKIASWSWESPLGESVDAVQLQELVENRRVELEKVFSSDAVEALSKDPTSIFDSMPDPQKSILARLANAEG